MLQKLLKSASNSEQAVITKSAEGKKTSLPKEQVEITDLHKPVLNKIMTTRDQCVKYNFVASLNQSGSFDEARPLPRLIWENNFHHPDFNELNLMRNLVMDVSTFSWPWTFSLSLKLFFSLISMNSFFLNSS